MCDINSKIAEVKPLLTYNSSRPAALVLTSNLVKPSLNKRNTDDHSNNKTANILSSPEALNIKSDLKSA